MLDQETKHSVLQQWDSLWNPTPKSTPKSKWTGCKFRPSPVIADIPEMEDGPFQQLKAEIHQAAIQGTLDQFGKIVLYKNKATGRWEIWDGRSRYLAFASLGLEPSLQFNGKGVSDKDRLGMTIRTNVEHRAWASADDLQAFLNLASAAMAKLAIPDKVNT